MNESRYNEFRAADAFEFVDAVRACNCSKDEAKRRILALNERMSRLEEKGEEISPALLAAYRGYEFVLAPTPMMVIKLNDAV